MSVIFQNTATKGFIFRCTNATEDECVKRMLFGEIPKYVDIVKKVQVGDSLFLLNVSSGRFYGEFEAVSNGQMNIEKDAWGGRFPCQVKVKRISNYPPITKMDLQKVVEFKTKHIGTYPEAILNEEQINTLRKFFKSRKELPTVEMEFRDRFPAKKRTDDGHLVRSAGELAIDNWLFSHDFSHGYERQLPTEEKAYCDFYLRDGKKYVYVELWGLNDVEYEERKRKKIEIYKKNNLPLIELTPKDLDNLDEKLSQKLLKYFTDHRF